MMNTGILRNGWLLLWVLALAACSSTVPPTNVKANARLTPTTGFTRALTQLPEPKTKIPVAVYGLRDQTGQYKASPDSPYSTEVTQGAATMLVDALRDSGWYIPVEREGLQNLLTERRIVRAIESPGDKGKQVINLPNLLPASLIIEGGVVGYDTNVRSGGKGANFLGIGASTQYRVDQVTVELRSVDIRTGQVLDTVSVTKTIYSYQFDASVYKFTSYQELLQGETGYTTNEPSQLAVKEAIEAAVVHLTIQGVRERVLELKNEEDWNSPLIQSYLREDLANAKGERPDNDEEVAQIPLPPQTEEKAKQVVRPLTMSEAAATAVQNVGQAAEPAPVSASGPATPVQSAQPAPSANVAPTPAAAALTRPPFTDMTSNAPAKSKEVAAPIPVPASAPAPVATPASAPAPVSAPATPAPPLNSAAAPATAAKTGTDTAAVKKPSSSDDIFRMYWLDKQ